MASPVFSVEKAAYLDTVRERLLALSPGPRLWGYGLAAACRRVLSADSRLLEEAGRVLCGRPLPESRAASATAVALVERWIEAGESHPLLLPFNLGGKTAEDCCVACVLFHRKGFVPEDPEVYRNVREELHQAVLDHGLADRGTPLSAACRALLEKNGADFFAVRPFAEDYRTRRGHSLMSSALFCSSDIGGYLERHPGHLALAGLSTETTGIFPHDLPAIPWYAKRYGLPGEARRYPDILLAGPHLYGCAMTQWVFPAYTEYELRQKNAPWHLPMVATRIHGAYNSEYTKGGIFFREEALKLLANEETLRMPAPEKTKTHLAMADYMALLATLSLRHCDEEGRLLSLTRVLTILMDFPGAENLAYLPGELKTSHRWDEGVKSVKEVPWTDLPARTLALASRCGGVFRYPSSLQEDLPDFAEDLARTRCGLPALRALADALDSHALLWREDRDMPFAESVHEALGCLERTRRSEAVRIVGPQPEGPVPYEPLL
jgi:hypothetical protein